MQFHLIFDLRPFDPGKAAGTGCARSIYKDIERPRIDACPFDRFFIRHVANQMAAANSTRQVGDKCLPPRGNDDLIAIIA